MKKSAIIPAALFVAVALVSLLCQSATLDLQANFGLFLLTPDYLRETLSYPWPISTLLSSFLVQFYDIPVVGELITAALITCIYLCTNALLRRCRIPMHRVVALAGACVCWWFAARQETNWLPVCIALISAVAALLSLILKKCEPKALALPEALVAVVILAAACTSIATSKDIRRQERVASVQIDARRHRWDEVLKVATVDNARDDARLIPFAALALGEKDLLGERIFQYPLAGPQSFDFEGENSQIGSFYNSLLNECLGSPNEALHHIFQFSCHLPHTLSHVSLYQMVKYNIEGGNIALARKYAEVLRHSPRNRGTAAKMLRLYADTPVQDTTYRANPVSRVVTNNPAYNLGQYQLAGLASSHLAQRFLCYMLLQGDLDGFRDAFGALDWTGRQIPVHYQEALLLAGIDPDAIGVSQERQSRFAAFVNAMQAGDRDAVQSAARGTYWAYYLAVQDAQMSEE